MIPLESYRSLFWKNFIVNNIVKISKKYLPQTCSRACLVAKVYFSISLLWQQRWRYRHLQDRNRSRVWLNFINNRSRLPFAMVLHGAAYLLLRKSTIGLSTGLTNKQGWIFSSKYIDTYLQMKKTIFWPGALLLQWNNNWIRNSNK